jgi:serine/threonine-protein kinase
MSLAPSSRVGPYEILGLIGSGGMGEVYKARDTRLERTVALKVLSDNLSSDPEHRARFEREAKTIASLSHARICTLFDVGEHAGSTFLVMELLDGETLAQRLRRGALAPGVALEIAAEIAEALAAAHRHGIVHRDIKPANVMLTASGVKLLDFGLARASRHHATVGALASLSTHSVPLTSEGVIVGTLQYMAPEQIEGKAADARADVWALGATLYEMLTGKRAFDGASAASVIGSILNTEPPALSGVQPHTPPSVDRLVRKCLAKDPDARWQSAADLADELRWVKDAGAGVVANVHRPMRVAVVVAAGTLLVAAGALAMAWRLRPEPPNATVVTTTIEMEEGLWLDGVRRAEDLERPSRTAVAISPDGRFVVYSASKAQTEPRLYLRRMDKPDATPIAGTERGIAPFISPDSRWIGFWADGKLKKISVEGGVATALADVPLPFGASWGPNDIILMSSEPSPGLSAVSADGGTSQTWTTPDPKRNEASHRLPSWLPDGTGVLFTVMRHGYDAHPWVAVLRADTREWRVLIEDAADARFVATGHLVFLRQGTLMGVGFDANRLEIVGRPVAIVEGVMQAFAPATRFNTAAGQFSVSDTGTLVYAAGGVAPDISNSLVWVDHAGVEAAAATKRSSYFAPRLSPDGKKIAYLFYGQERQLWIYDLERETNTRLHDRGMSSYPLWYPDGQRLLFGWQEAIRINLYRQPADRSAPMQRVTTNDCDQRVGSWAPDGDTVAIVQSCAGQWDIFLLSARSGQVTPLFATAANEMFPEFSPDGAWIAYTSNETKREEVYVQRWRGGGRYQVSTGGGMQPLWSRDGTRLFYRWLDQVWVADIRTDNGFAASRPRLIFERRGYSMGAPIRGYDLSLDSRRFLMVKLDDRQPSPATELTLVQHWFEELNAKVPRGK